MLLPKVIDVLEDKNLFMKKFQKKNENSERNEIQVIEYMHYYIQGFSLILARFDYQKKEWDRGLRETFSRAISIEFLEK